MNDEPKTIEAIYGPYAGQRLLMQAADADQAIADGWARDPFAKPSDEPAKELSGEDVSKIQEKAEKAARKLRGEEPKEESEEKSKDKPEAARPEPKTERKVLDPEPAPKAGYQTREVPPAKKR